MTIGCKFTWLSRLFRKTRKNLAFKSRESHEVDGRLQQISRILCPALQGRAVWPRRIATPIHPRVPVFPSQLSIRPDSPCHQLMETRFRSAGGIDLPGLKTLLPA
jgi:hypothetical protein